MSKDKDKNNLKETIGDTITDYVLYLQEDDEEQLGFWSSWKQLYLFVLFYGILQIMILYFFTLFFNHN